jgi:hypothetical protein
VERKKPPETENKDRPHEAVPEQAAGKTSDRTRKNGGWQEIEALREKAALKASLADVWDEEFDLDDDILAELDHKAEFFTRQEEAEEEDFDEDEEIDEFFEDDEV